jgi:hypothetical protein
MVGFEGRMVTVREGLEMEVTTTIVVASRLTWVEVEEEAT